LPIRARSGNLADEARQGGQLLVLNTLLDSAGLTPADTLVARHTPKERALRRVMPWMVAERADLFAVFQALQAESFEKAMTRAKFMASFLENGPKSAIFAGLYRIDGHRRVNHEEYWAIAENQELRELGMEGMEAGSRDPLLFDLSLMEPMSDWIGKLCIGWPGLERSWWRWADRNVMPVTAIHAESAFARGMPAWEDLVLSWSELQLLPATWRARLAEWRGIYFIFDVARGQGYVGSAYGQDNILGRWRSYAATGHGGNVKLRDSDPADLRFSILQRTSPDTLGEEVVALESAWKARLHTRSHGLNVN